MLKIQVEPQAAGGWFHCKGCAHKKSNNFHCKVCAHKMSKILVTFPQVRVQVSTGHHDEINSVKSVS